MTNQDIKGDEIDIILERGGSVQNRMGKDGFQEKLSKNPVRRLFALWQGWENEMAAVEVLS